jgi:hypothetical protein
MFVRVDMEGRHQARYLVKYPTGTLTLVGPEDLLRILAAGREVTVRKFEQQPRQEQATPVGSYLAK